VDDQGDTIGITSLVQDVTEQARAQEQLAKREEDLRHITNSLPALISYIDRDGRYRFNNQTYKDWLGVDPAELLGKTIVDLYGDEFHQQVAPQISSVLSGTTVRFEHTIQRQDGTNRYVDVSLVPHSTSGGVAGFYVLAIDATERKTAERELAEYRDHLEDVVSQRTVQLQASSERLRQAERLASLGTLAAGVGHDIGNLLLPMRCLLDTICVPPSDHSGAVAGADTGFERSVASLRQSLDFLGNLAESLLALAAAPDAASGGGRVVLDQWWATAEPMLRSALPPDARLHVSIPSGLPEVAISPVQLTRTVLNLLINAAEASGVGARMLVEALAAPGVPSQVLLRVHDDGSGMTNEVRRRAMEPFFTTKRRGISTGLGLALVHAAVNAAGGSVQIDSAPGRGTTVCLVLPGAPTPASGGRPELPRDPVRERVHLSVLDERIAAFLTAYLAANEFEVVPATPGPLAAPGIWIIDGHGHTPSIEDPRGFASLEGGRWVILLGPVEDQWRSTGARVVADPGDLQTLIAAVRESVTKARAGKSP